MAIKVGKKKESMRKPYWHVECDKCGCVFLASQDDIDHENFQYNEYCYSSAKCPDCGKLVSFDKRKQSAVPTKDELYMIDNASRPLPDPSDILQAFQMFDKYGLVKSDLCFDPEHFINTVIMEHWRDFTPKTERQ